MCWCDFLYHVPLPVPVQDGWTALHLTSQDGHADVVRVLIEANARVNQRSKVI